MDLENISLYLICETLIEMYKHLKKKIHISEPIPIRLYFGNYLSDAPRHFIAPLVKETQQIALPSHFWILTNVSRPAIYWVDDYQGPQDTLAIFSGSISTYILGEIEWTKNIKKIFFCTRKISSHTKYRYTRQLIFSKRKSLFRINPSHDICWKLLPRNTMARVCSWFVTLWVLVFVLMQSW